MKSLSAFVCLSIVVVAHADTSYYGNYVKGAKIGFTRLTKSTETFGGHPAIRYEDYTEATIAIEGAKTKWVTTSTAWCTPDNRPLRETTSTRVGSRVEKTDAVFGPKSVEIDISVEGKMTHHSVPLPDGPILENFNQVVLDHAPGKGQTFTFWRLSAMELLFEKVDVKNLGSETLTSEGKAFRGTIADVTVSGSTERMFVDAKGVTAREEYERGAVGSLEPKEMAMKGVVGDASLPDLVEIYSIPADKELDDPLHLTELTLRIKGSNFSSLPSDNTQTATQDKGDWVVAIHPAQIAESEPTSLPAAAVGQAEWLRPGRFIPSDSEELKALAKKVVGKEDTVLGAALAIEKYVHKLMIPDTGVGVARDATQILHEKRGKCTDYAILSVTLMRAAGVPARLACGLIGNQSYYYHAWAEAWDGKRWVGIDSVLGERQMPACYIKLSSGNAEAFSFVRSSKESTKIEILGTKYRG